MLSSEPLFNKKSEENFISAKRRNMHKPEFIPNIDSLIDNSEKGKTVQWEHFEHEGFDSLQLTSVLAKEKYLRPLVNPEKFPDIKKDAEEGEAPACGVRV